MYISSCFYVISRHHTTQDITWWSHSRHAPRRGDIPSPSPRGSTSEPSHPIPEHVRNTHEKIHTWATFRVGGDDDVRDDEASYRSTQRHARRATKSSFARDASQGARRARRCGRDARDDRLQPSPRGVYRSRIQNQRAPRKRSRRHALAYEACSIESQTSTCA